MAGMHGMGDMFIHTRTFLEKETLNALRKQKDQERLEKREREKRMGDPSRSLYLFWNDGCIRRLTVWVVGHKFFSKFVLIVIMVNCFFLAMDNFPPTGSPKAILLERAENTFMAIFSTEAALKIVAYGFLYAGPQSYIRNSWNQLDFTVVVLGFLGYIPHMGNFSIIRMFRLLRPLRAINQLPGMKTLVTALIGSLGSLAHVSFLLFFMVFVFAILGLQLWSGMFSHQCFLTASGEVVPFNIWPHGCSPDFPAQGWGCQGALEASIANQSWSIFAGTLSTDDTNAFFCGRATLGPNFGITNFDNVGQAMITIAQCITLEGWSDLLYLAQEVSSSVPSTLYFVGIIFVGGFFVVNLITAIVFLRFEQSKRNAAIDIARALRKGPRDKSTRRTGQSSGTRSHSSESGGEEPANVDAGMKPVPVGRKISDSDSDEDEKCEYDKQMDNPNNTDSFMFRRQTTLARGLLVHNNPNQAPASVTINNAVAPLEIKTSNPALSFALLQTPSPRSGRCRCCFFVPAPRLAKTVNSKSFELAVTLAILINTGVLAGNGYDTAEATVLQLERINFALYVFFLFEALLKLLALGCVRYFSSGFNCFDCAIVTSSTLELFLGGSIPIVSLLRIVRLLRLFKLVRLWPSLGLILDAVTMSIADIFYFSILLFMFLFIIAVIGMQIFPEPLLYPDGSEIRTGYSNFGMAWLAAFQVLTGEDWNDLMYSGVHQAGWGSFFYFITNFVSGNYILLSAFFAIMLSNFDRIKSKESGEKWHHALFRRLGCRSVDEAETPVLQHEIVISKGSILADEGLMQSHVASSIPDTKVVLFGHSLTIIPPFDERRVALLRLISSDAFNYTIGTAIFVSVILLAFDSPSLDPDSSTANNLESADIVLTIVFVLEAMCKIIVYGFAFGKGTYLQDPWNAMDFFVVLVSVLHILLASISKQLKIFRLFRVLKSIRTLRMVSNIGDLKLIAQSIISTLPSLGNVVLIALMIYTVFAILGVMLFGGCTAACFSLNHTLMLVNRSECTSDVGMWRNRFWSFDDFPAAMMTLFEVKSLIFQSRPDNPDKPNNPDNPDNPNNYKHLTQVGSLSQWPSVMYMLVDTTEPGQAPVRNNKPLAAGYIVLFILLATFVVMSLFVGVVVDEYVQQHAIHTNSAHLSYSQKHFLEAFKDTVSLDFPMPLVRPKKRGRKSQDVLWFRFRNWCYDTALSQLLERTVLVSILLNMVIMALVHYGMSPHYELALEDINRVFTVVFFLEAFIKLNGFGARQYFRSSWNSFDFFIVVISLIQEALMAVQFDGKIFRVLRLLRVMRSIRLVKRFKGLQQIIATLMFSLPAMTNVGMLLFLIFYVYAVLGMALLSGIKFGDYLNEHANFNTFSTALLTLFRCCTGENWNGLMHDCAVQPPFCTEGVDCGYPVLAVWFFASFNMITNMLTLNVFVAVVVKNFELELKKDPLRSKNPFVETILQDFAQQFAFYAGDKGIVMRADKLRGFLRSVKPGPFRLQVNQLSASGLSRYLCEINLPHYNGEIHFVDLTIAMVHRALFLGKPHGVSNSNEFLASARDSALNKYSFLASTKLFIYNAGNHLSALAIQRAWRRKKQLVYTASPTKTFSFISATKFFRKKAILPRHSITKLKRHESLKELREARKVTISGEMNRLLNTTAVVSLPRQVEEQKLQLKNNSVEMTATRNSSIVSTHSCASEEVSRAGTVSGITVSGNE